MTTAATSPVDPRFARLQAGEPLVFSLPEGRKEEPSEREARTIPAKWLADLAEGFNRTVPVPVSVSHAIISGPLDLRHAAFECEVSITDCDFTDPVDLSFVVFKCSATLKDCHFLQTVDCRGCHAQADFNIEGASFAGDATFQDMRVEKLLDASGAAFSKANFQRISVEKGAFFRTDGPRKRTIFNGECRFDSGHIVGGVDFQGAEFNSQVWFDGFHVDDYAFFQVDDLSNRTTFRDHARFVRARIGGNAQFNGVLFEKNAVFDGSEMAGYAFFHDATFAGSADFLNARIGSDAEFQGAEFKSSARFVNLKVGGHAIFRPTDGGKQTSFAQGAEFSHAEIAGNAEFQGVQFGDLANFFNSKIGAFAFFDRDNWARPVVFCAEARFTNVVFRCPAIFLSAEFHDKAAFSGSRFQDEARFDSARFRSEANFSTSSADRGVKFAGAEFSGVTTFRDAKLQVVEFAQPPKEQSKDRRTFWSKDPELSAPATFQTTLDLRGLSYERMYAQDRIFEWLSPFDRQPYTQFESTLRRAGDDRRANGVYLARRHMERKEKFRARMWHFWLFDWLYKLGANYGVRPFRLIAYGVAFIAFGALVFSQQGALQPKEGEGNVGTRCSFAAEAAFKEALGVSVHYFLPMDSPIGSTSCLPSRKAVSVPVLPCKPPITLLVRPDWYGTVLRLAGAILMGIGLAAITGLLRRIAS